jgi:beta-glucosidase
MKRCLSTLTLVCVLGAGLSTAQMKQSTNDDPRVETLLGSLTLEEKLEMLGGTGFETKAVPRLGIPALTMTDGPVGVRFNQSSAFPVSIMMASTWNPELIGRLGEALGQEAKAQGRRMLLGPCVNIHRTPFGGRNFESFGEDPYLAARIAVAYVQGVQREKVVATTKHFACNNQEFERDFTNVTIGERALHEIYLPAFEAAVTEAGSMSVMSAYNKVNGLWCSENPHLLTDILKNDWQFKGFVVSDWGAVHSSAPTVNAGLDVEMPEGKHLKPDSLLPLIKNGIISESIINDKVRRLLRTIIWTGLMDGGEKDHGQLNTNAHQALAREVAREGIVLLKNEGGALPLNASSVKSLAVIGPNAKVARPGGGGSSQVDPLYAVAPFEGFKNLLGAGVSVKFARGCTIEGDITPIGNDVLTPAGGPEGIHGLKAEYFSNMSLSGQPLVTRIDATIDFNWGDGSPDKAIPVDNFSARWTGFVTPAASGRYTFRAMTDDGARVFLDGKLVIDDWIDHGPSTQSFTTTLEAGRKYSITMEYYEHGGGAVARLGWEASDQKLLPEAVELAKSCDAVVLCLGLGPQFESEGFDRKTLELPEEQVALLKAVAAVNKKTVVVLNTGSPIIAEEWLGNIPALIQSWYPGEEGGNAVAEAVFGKMNPSGKLPMTWMKRWEDSPAFGNFPGKSTVNYAEGVFVGYRHFDTKKVDVTFPFGHGLSYTQFAYSHPVVRPVKKLRPVEAEVSVDVSNTGTAAGSEVVQLYIHPAQSSVERPEQELKGFRKIALKPGETTTVTFKLNDRSFSWYDAAATSWNVDPGTYELRFGSSSRDIRVKTSLKVE